MKILVNLKNKTAVLKETNWLRVLLVVAMITLGVLYIWQVNAKATNGFAMRDLEKEISTLSIENERLDVKVSHLQSIDSVSTRVQMLGLVKINDVNYVSGASAVAIR